MITKESTVISVLRIFMIEVQPAGGLARDIYKYKNANGRPRDTINNSIKFRHVCYAVVGVWFTV